MTTPSVREAAAAIDGLLPALDRPIDGMSREQVIAQALVRRGRHLYRSANRNLDEGDAIAAGVLVRSLMDLLILVRWAEDDPENHIEMWIAEDTNDSVRPAPRSIASSANGGDGCGATKFRSQISKLGRADVARVREAALARNEPGVGERGSVVPGLETMSQCADDLWEVYQVAFRVLSDIAHSGGRSFVRDRVEVRGPRHTSCPRRHSPSTISAC